MGAQQKIKTWIQNRITDNNTYHDLHIDTIGKKYKSSSAWIEGGLEVLTIANSQLNNERFALVLAIHLLSKNKVIGCNFNKKADLSAQLTRTPPSIYLVEKESEMWKYIMATLKVDIVDIPDVFEAYYQEAKRSDGDYLRVIFILYNPKA